MNRRKIVSSIRAVIAFQGRPNAAAKLPPAALEFKSRAIGGQLQPLVRLPLIESLQPAPVISKGIIQLAPSDLQETRKRGAAT